MTDFGLTPEGFVTKPLTVILEEIEADERAAFGQSIDTASSKSVFGNVNGIVSERLASLWALGEALDASTDPDRATNTSLDKVCAYTGTIREGARSTTADLTLAGTPGTLITAGHQASVLSTKVKFQTDEDATIVVLDDYAVLTTYAIGDRVTNTGYCYVAEAGGVSGSGAGPVGTILFATETDAGVTWRNIGQGTGVVDVGATALVTGPLVALAGTLSVIEQPISGWTTVVNTLDATLGAEVEQDPALRVRREQEVVADANASIPAIRVKVAKVGEGTNNPVTSCRVFQNVTMLVDGNGLPPKSIEVLVLGGEDQDIADTIFAAVAGGIETYGNTTCTVVDSQGTSWTIKFSRPVERQVFVTVDVTKDPAFFPAAPGGEQAVINAIVQYGLTYTIGKDVTPSAVASRIWAIPGVLAVEPLPRIDFSAAPVLQDPLPIGDHELAVIDSSHILVNLIDGSP